MNVLALIGGILLLIASILIITLVVMQDSKQSGMSAMTGGQSDSYLSKNKGKTLESKLVFATKIFVITFFVITVGLNLIIRYVK